MDLSFILCVCDRRPHLKFIARTNLALVFYICNRSLLFEFNAVGVPCSLARLATNEHLAHVVVVLVLVCDTFEREIIEWNSSEREIIRLPLN